MQYDAGAVAAYFDEFGVREWDRLEQSIEAEVNLAVHTHYLRRYIQPGWRVLEVGAGAGRFTVELARLGARILVADISNVQLDLNRSKVTESGLEALVEDRLLLDGVDMSILPTGSFDCVVCYGGPLSYAMDRRSMRSTSAYASRSRVPRSCSASCPCGAPRYGGRRVRGTRVRGSRPSYNRRRDQTAWMTGRPCREPRWGSA